MSCGSVSVVGCGSVRTRSPNRARSEPSPRWPHSLESACRPASGLHRAPPRCRASARYGGHLCVSTATVAFGAEYALKLDPRTDHPTPDRAQLVRLCHRVPRWPECCQNKRRSHDLRAALRFLIRLPTTSMEVAQLCRIVLLISCGKLRPDSRRSPSRPRSSPSTACRRQFASGLSCSARSCSIVFSAASSSPASNSIAA